MKDQEIMSEAIKLHKEGKLEEAIEKYNTFLESVPDSKEGHYNKRYLFCHKQFCYLSGRRIPE